MDTGGMTREERLAYHAERVEREEEVESLKKRVDTKLDPDELRRRLELLRRKKENLQGKLRAAECPEVVRQSEVFGACLQAAKKANSAKAKALANVGKAESSGRDEIRRLEEQLAKAKKKRNERLGKVRGEYVEADRIFGIAKTRLAEAVTSLLEVAKEAKFDASNLLEPAREFGVLPKAKVVEAGTKLEYAEDWFAGSPRTWLEWKKLLNERGIKLQDRTGKKSSDVLSGEEARNLFDSCPRIVPREAYVEIPVKD